MPTGHDLSPTSLMVRTLLASLVAIGVLLMAGNVAQAADATITINADKQLGSICPRLFGEFSEVIYNSTDGILGAEKLRNRGFEIMPTQAGTTSPLQQTDPWERTLGPDSSGSFSLDGFVTPIRFADYPNHAQQIILRRGEARLCQRSMSVKAGEVLDISLWLCQTGFTGTIELGFTDRMQKTTYATHVITAFTPGWKPYTCTLTMPQADPEAVFFLTVKGKGTVWLDQLSVMPKDNVQGYRPEVRDIFTRMAPKTVRIFGGIQNDHWHWKDWIGPRDRRPATVGYWGVNWVEPGNIGLDEAIRFWQDEVGAEVTLCVNVGNGRWPQDPTRPDNSLERALADARDLIEYCNGPVTSKWGKVRADNGHPAPYNIKLWELGNEKGNVYAKDPRIHVDAARQYGQVCTQFARTLKGVDPGIEIIASGAYKLPVWDIELLKTAGSWIDYLAWHRYDFFANTEDVLASPTHLEAVYRDRYRQIEPYVPPGKRIRIAFNEWAGGSLRKGYGTERRGNCIDAVLYAAGVCHAFLRMTDIIAMTNSTDAFCDVMVGGEPIYGNADDTSAYGNQVWTSPRLEALILESRHHGDILVASDVTCGTFTAPAYNMGDAYLPAGQRFNLLNVVATRSDNTLYLSVINLGEPPIRAQVHLPGVKVANAFAQIIAAPSREARNFPPATDAIAVKPGVAPPVATDFAYDFPGYSVSVLEFDLAK